LKRKVHHCIRRPYHWTLYWNIRMSIHILQPNIVQIHFNITIPSMSRSSFQGFSAEYLYLFFSIVVFTWRSFILIFPLLVVSICVSVLCWLNMIHVRRKKKKINYLAVTFYYLCLQTAVEKAEDDKPKCSQHSQHLQPSCLLHKCHSSLSLLFVNDITTSLLIP
jgi:hypothetical protein